MPLIQVTAAQGALNKSQQDALMQKLSNAVLTAERAPITDAGAQSLVWAYYQELPNGGIYIGGKNIEQPPIRVAITTPEGALNTASRASLAANIGEIVDEFIGAFEGRLSHWAMMYEVSEGSWAGGGQVFPLLGIQQAMNIKAA